MQRLTILQKISKIWGFLGEFYFSLGNLNGKISTIAIVISLISKAFAIFYLIAKKENKKHKNNKKQNIIANRKAYLPNKLEKWKNEFPSQFFLKFF